MKYYLSISHEQPLPPSPLWAFLSISKIVLTPYIVFWTKIYSFSFVYFSGRAILVELCLGAEKDTGLLGNVPYHYGSPRWGLDLSFSIFAQPVGRCWKKPLLRTYQKTNLSRSVLAVAPCLLKLCKIEDWFHLRNDESIELIVSKSLLAVYHQIFK